MNEEEYPKEVVFIMKSKEDEADLFELLYKHKVECEPVLQERDTYDLDFESWCD